MPRATPLCRQLFGLVASIGLVVLAAGSAAAGQIGFVYALQQGSSSANQIYGFRFEPSTGVLTLLPGFPVASGGTGPAGTTSSEHLAYFDGRLYAINDGDNTMTAFSVNRSTGALTAMPFSPIALGTGTWTCVAVHPSGSPVVAGNSQGTLASFVVTNTTATAAAGSPYAAASGPISCAFSQGGSFVYGGGNFGTGIAGFSVNAGTGVLTALAGSPFNSGGNNPFGFATDSSGRLFTVMLSAGEIRGFTTAAGVPTGIVTNPAGSGLTRGTHAVLRRTELHGFYSFYMVADRMGNQVGVYQIAGDGDTTTINAIGGSPFATGGTFTNALVLTPDGAHLLAANGNSRNLTVFQVNPTSGALSSIGVQPANTLGASGVITGLAFAPGEAGFVYTVQQVSGGANMVHGFRINPSTAALTPIDGLPIPTGGTGTDTIYSEHIGYNNGRLYVLNDGDDTLTAFKVNRATGALTALPFSPIALGPGTWACVVVHPSGSPVVVGNYLAGRLASFDVGATTATAAPGSPFATGTTSPVSCGFSRDGNYLYSGGLNTQSFNGFSVNADTGVLAPLTGSPFFSGSNTPRGYATDGAGRLFMATSSGPQVRAFRTTAGVPAIEFAGPSGLSSGVHGVHHPSGFYMVADQSGNRVGVYRISGPVDNTTVLAIPGSPFASGGTTTNALALTEDGGLLVAANGATRNLTVFKVSAATGGLTSLAVQPANTLGATGMLSGIAFVPVVPPFIDDPLTAVTPVIKAVHFVELRTRIDAVRAQNGLGPYSYTDPTLAVATTVVRAVHITDLRTALAEVYSAIGMTPPSYTDPTLDTASTVVKMTHVSELRAAVLAIE